MQKSLKVRVFVTFLAVAVVAVSALGAVSYFSGKHMLQKQIQDSYTNISNSREGEVVLALEAAKVEFALVAGDYHIRELAEKVVKNDPDAPRALSELIAYAKEFLVTTKNSFEYFSWICGAGFSRQLRKTISGPTGPGMPISSTGRKGYISKTSISPMLRGRWVLRWRARFSRSIPGNF